MRFLFSLTLVLTGCSVLGLDDFDRCDTFGETVEEQEAACASALNDEFGFPDTCRPFRCIAGRCDLQRDVELCDSADNDCDGTVDENVFAPSGLAGVQYGMRPRHLTVAAGASESRAFWTDDTTGPGASGAAIAPVIGETREELRYARHEDGGGDGIDQGILSGAEVLESGCWRRVVSGVPAVRTDDNCDFLDLQVSRSGTHTFAAALSGRGSAQGLLRLGELAGTADLRVVGPLARSNSFLGVGLTEDGVRSAAVPANCQAAVDAAGGTTPTPCGGGCGAGQFCVCNQCRTPEQIEVERQCGFAAMAVDAIPSPGGDVGVQLHGLVGAIGGSAQCRVEDLVETPEDEAVRPVAVIGGFIENRGSNSFTTATDEGVPLVLGETRGNGAPGVLGTGAAFVVGFPNTSGDLAVSIVGPFVEPRPYDTNGCDSSPGDLVSCSDGPTQQARCQFTTCGSDTGVCVAGAGMCLAGEEVCNGLREPDPIETCGNALDDDCDGRTDETECAACVAAAETCNASDDDCDGMVDEEVVDTLGGAALGEACGSDVGTCSSGTVACEGGQLLCTGGVLPRRNVRDALEDLCGNTLDDDCDGTVDEAGCGACEMGPTGREECTGRDDDCDGMVDESPPDRALNFPELAPNPSQRDAETIRQCIASEPITTPSDATVDGFGREFDDVVLAAGPDDFTTRRIGVAWRDIMDDQFRIGFRIIEMDATCVCTTGGACADREDCEPVVTPTGLRSSSAPLVLAGAGEHGPPTIVYSPTGFDVSGGGGWYILWTEGDQLVGVRVSGAGVVLDDTPFVADRGAMADKGLARAFRGDFAGYVYADHGAGEVVTGRLQCAPR